MISGRNPNIDMLSTYIQPSKFADYLSYQQDYCLFLDIDGTLAGFTLNPQDSVIPNTTLTLLKKIQNHGVKIAIVTGRSLLEARQMLSPMQLPIAATHGLEIAFDDGEDRDNDGINVIHIDTTELMAIKQLIIQSCKPYPDLTIENKPYSVALHYRQDPTLADVADNIVSDVLNSHPDWTVKRGKCVCEVVPKGINKGAAILTLLKKMQASDTLYPIFIGDDVTDEAGFMAIQAQEQLVEKPEKTMTGMGIKVGSEPTCAHYYVHSIDEVSGLLDSFLTFCQTRATLSSVSVDAGFPSADKTVRCLV